MRSFLLSTLLLWSAAGYAVTPAFEITDPVSGSGVLPDSTSTAPETHADAYVPVTYCYSRYVGNWGWGYYYGYSNLPAQAWNNAIVLCRYNHSYDPNACIVTHCQRY